MSIKDTFTERCKVFSQQSDKLYKQLDELADKLIILDLNKKLELDLDKGTNKINNNKYFDEIRIENRVFNFINRTEEIYKAYVLHFVKTFNEPGLGFKYKDEIVSPHIDGQANSLIEIYNDVELTEILAEIEIRINAINDDLYLIEQEKDLTKSKYYYRDYNGMFDGEQKFNDIDAVINDFKALSK